MQQFPNWLLLTIFNSIKFYIPKIIKRHYVLCFVNTYIYKIYAMLCFAFIYGHNCFEKRKSFVFTRFSRWKKRLTGVLQHTYHTKFQAISANLSVNRCVSALLQWSQQLCEAAYHIRQWYLCGVELLPNPTRGHLSAQLADTTDQRHNIDQGQE